MPRPAKPIPKACLEFIKNTFTYDPETGSIERDGQSVLRQYHKRHYVSVLVYTNKKQRVLRASRIAWFLQYGVWTTKPIHYANHDVTDLRIENLVMAKDVPLPRISRGRHHDKTSSKYKGVHRLHNDSWVAEIGLQNERHYLGCFESAEEAAEAYNAKAKELYGDLAVLNVISESVDI